jgi:hypothetical protein
VPIAPRHSWQRRKHWKISGVDRAEEFFDAQRRDPANHHIGDRQSAAAGTETTFFSGFTGVSPRR